MHFLLSNFQPSIVLQDSYFYFFFFHQPQPLLVFLFLSHLEFFPCILHFYPLAFTYKLVTPVTKPSTCSREHLCVCVVGGKGQAGMVFLLPVGTSNWNQFVTGKSSVYWTDSLKLLSNKVFPRVPIMVNVVNCHSAGVSSIFFTHCLGK